MTYDIRLYQANYAEVTADSFLTSNRVLTAGNNLFQVDAGAGSTFTRQILKQATQSSTALLVPTSSSVQYGNASGAAFAITLPSASSCVDKVFLFKKVDSSGNAITVTANGPGDTIDSASTYALSAQYDFVMIQSNGVANWRILGKSYGTGTFAPADATYVTLSANSTLTNERVLTAGNNVFLTDAGANSTVTVEINPITNDSTNQTLSSTSNTVRFMDASGGARTYALPAATVVKTLIIKKIDSSTNTVTINRAGSDTIDGATSYILYVQYQSITLQSDGISSWNIV